MCQLGHAIGNIVFLPSLEINCSVPGLIFDIDIPELLHVDFTPCYYSLTGRLEGEAYWTIMCKCSIWIAQWAAYSVQFAVCSVQYAVCSAQCTVFTVQCAVCSV